MVVWIIREVRRRRCQVWGKAIIRHQIQRIGPGHSDAEIAQVRYREIGSESESERQFVPVDDSDTRKKVDQIFDARDMILEGIKPGLARPSGSDEPLEDILWTHLVCTSPPWEVLWFRRSRYSRLDGMACMHTYPTCVLIARKYFFKLKMPVSTALFI